MTHNAKVGAGDAAVQGDMLLPANDKAQPDAQGSLRGSAGLPGSTPGTNGEKT